MRKLQAKEHYKCVLRKKTWDCLKILKQLSVKPEPNARDSLTCNNISLRFLLDILTSGLDTEARTKFEYFWGHQKQDEIATLLKTFGKYSAVPKEALTSISSSMTMNTKRTVFLTLRSNVHKHKE